MVRGTEPGDNAEAAGYSRIPLVQVGAATLGGAAGLSVFIGLGGLGWFGFVGTPLRLGLSALPGHVVATIAVLILAGALTLAAASARGSGLRAADAGASGSRVADARALGPGASGPRVIGPQAIGPQVIAARAIGSSVIGPSVIGARVIGARIAARAGVAAILAAWCVAAYDNSWTAGGWTDFGHTAMLIATLGFVPLSACLAAAAGALMVATARPVLAAHDMTARKVLAQQDMTARKVLAQQDMTARPVLAQQDMTARTVLAAHDTTGRPVPRAVRVRRWAAIAAVIVSGGWLGYVTLPYVFSWGPVLLVLLACVAVLAVTGRRSSTAR